MNPCIYDSWASCSKQVIKFKGVVHKKYSSWDEAYTAWVTHTRQVDQLVPPSLISLLDDAAGSSTEFTLQDQAGFPFTVIIALSLCFCVIVAVVMFYLL
ncbi:hypothetical protein RHMOL_Rhmol06G0184600 [Rhododendron molle]|uniref:Uncharacterized protein n=1 Tax=Rhododendron molle TaxID=49168 RepID=A0ACC0NFP4_RHOML|nr:hypothetical protein RHMOL_Rhmol06G0184600 [Rhododendron molle]